MLQEKGNKFFYDTIYIVLKNVYIYGVQDTKRGFMYAYVQI